MPLLNKKLLPLLLLFYTASAFPIIESSDKNAPAINTPQKHIIRNQKRKRKRRLLQAGIAVFASIIALVAGVSLYQHQCKRNEEKEAKTKREEEIKERKRIETLSKNIKKTIQNTTPQLNDLISGIDSNYARNFSLRARKTHLEEHYAAIEKQIQESASLENHDDHQQLLECAQHIHIALLCTILDKINTESDWQTAVDNLNKFLTAHAQCNLFPNCECKKLVGKAKLLASELKLPTHSRTLDFEPSFFEHYVQSLTSAT